MTTKPRYQPVVTQTPRLSDKALEGFLEPIRDVVRRSFFGRSAERAVTREDLVTLGLVSTADLNQLDN